MRELETGWQQISDGIIMWKCGWIRPKHEEGKIQREV